MGTISEKDKVAILKLKLDRDFSGHYLPNWMQVLLANENPLLPSSHVLYQEMDSAIATATSFPNNINNWSLYPTLFLHGLAIYTSSPLQTYELIRGTYYDGAIEIYYL